MSLCVKSQYFGCFFLLAFLALQLWRDELLQYVLYVVFSPQNGFVRQIKILCRFGQGQYFAIRLASFDAILFLVIQEHLTLTPVLSTLNLNVVLSLHPSLGAEDGDAVSVATGFEEGCEEGIFDVEGFDEVVGLMEGLEDGDMEGLREGTDEGLLQGTFDSDGLVDGDLNGALDGALLKDGLAVGLLVGLEVTGIEQVLHESWHLDFTVGQYVAIMFALFLASSSYFQSAKGS